MNSGAFDETAAAEYRTRLAGERTYLAWWRTGITALAVGLGAGKLLPSLNSDAAWPYTAIGLGFAALGIVCSVYALKRHREMGEAVSRGEFPAPDVGVPTLLSGGAALLGLALVVLLLT